MMTLVKSFVIIFLSYFILSETATLAQSVKGQSMRMHSIPLSRKKDTTARSVAKPVIGFVSLQTYENSGNETREAFDLLKSFGEFTTEFLTVRELEKSSKKNSRYSIIWIHKSDTTPFSNLDTNTRLIQSLQKYVHNGGKLLLTLQSVHYLNFLGFEASKLQDSIKSCRDEGYGRRLGIHSFRDHPIFSGLNGGAYICRPVNDTSLKITGLFGDRLPNKGKVVAVDWDYIFLREDSKLVIEYTPGNGKVLAIGGYMNFSIPNSNSSHLERFTLNCFHYLNDQMKRQTEFYWNYTKSEIKSCKPEPDIDQQHITPSPSVEWVVKTSEIDLKHRFATENFWDVAGERILTMGTENGGIEEVWAHPFMAFRDYEAGIRFDYKDTIYWLRDENPEVLVNPACFARQYKFPRAYLKEVVVNDPKEPNGVIHYEYRGVYSAELIIRFKSNLRWMWPYSDRVTGSICHSWNNDLGAITIQDYSSTLNVMIGGSKKPEYYLSGQFDGFSYENRDSAFRGDPTDKIQVAGLLCYKLSMNDNVDVIFSATNEGYDATLKQFSKSSHDPIHIYYNTLRHTRDILAKSLTITTPDPDFNRGYRWALVATDRFFVNTPGMGKALVAGYATTRHGWDGGHKVNGRPGYGWYFGRDAEWSSFALLDYGDFSKVKSQLEFFNKYQDLNGKIFHEASTSGLIHYDAADATPLYIVLAGKYFRHSNDTAFIRKIWPNVKRAINFCFSTDTDQDHLIENTNVGHGWVEGGELFGSHSTIYMAGTWGAALNEASNMANFMKDIELDGYRLKSAEQKRIIDSDFWSGSGQFFAYGKNKDGSFRKEQTILPAVPIYFRMADREKSIAALKIIAGNNFSTNWGVRILREDSKWFKPTGYHYGSVWPLFTGWASLAEYATGNSVQGFSHLMNNLNVYKQWGLGFVEEVLNGSEYQPSGVCSHQCWSETMVLQPAIEGLLGLEVMAQQQTISLAPQFPPQWDSVLVQNIRMADQRVNFHFLRENGNCKYLFTVDTGKPVHIKFMPVFPAGTRFIRMTLDGKEVPFTTFKSAESVTMIVSFDLQSASKLEIATEAGIAVLPATSDPKPGDAAEGMRILSSGLSGNLFQVEVEGKSGSSGILGIWTGGQSLQQAENGEFLDQIGRVSRFTVNFGRSEEKYVRKVLTVFVR